MIYKRLRSEIVQQLLSNLVWKEYNRVKPRSLTSLFNRSRAGRVIRLYAPLSGHPPSPQVENRPFSIWRGLLLMILPLVIYNYSIPSIDESRWAYVPSG